MTRKELIAKLESHPLLEYSKQNYWRNVEGRDIPFTEIQLLLEPDRFLPYRLNFGVFSKRIIIRLVRDDGTGRGSRPYLLRPKEAGYLVSQRSVLIQSFGSLEDWLEEALNKATEYDRGLQ